jgi:hypothetical protein
MKRWGLLVVTVVVILLTGLVLRGASRVGHRWRTGGLRTAPRESLSPSVALRHAQCQPTHWRDLLMAP